MYTFSEEKLQNGVKPIFRWERCSMGAVLDGSYKKTLFRSLARKIHFVPLGSTVINH